MFLDNQHVAHVQHVDHDLATFWLHFFRLTSGNSSATIGGLRPLICCLTARLILYSPREIERQISLADDAVELFIYGRSAKSAETFRLELPMPRGRARTLCSVRICRDAIDISFDARLSHSLHLTIMLSSLFIELFPHIE